MNPKGLGTKPESLIAEIEHLLGINHAKNNSLETIIEQVIHYYETIIGSMPGNVYWLDKHGIAVGCNKNVLQMFGLNSVTQFKGLTFDEMGKIGHWTPNAIQTFKTDTMEVIKTGISKLNIEEPPIPHNDGRIIHFLTHRVPLFDQQKKIVGMVGISIDITERKQLEMALKEAKDLAEAANKAKTEFIANMSHDIRTPLSGVIGLSQILEHSLSNVTQKEQAHLLHDSGEVLLTMLNEILDDLRAEHLSDNDLNEETFDIYQCIQDLVRLELPTTTLKHLKLAVTMDNDIPQYIVSDRKKIYRILLNLLGNAIKFTQSGQITIEVKCLDKDNTKAHLQFGVADTGVGIPKELQEKVFDRFFRVTSSYKGVYKGHGLGLHIAQSYVSLLGGHITLTSEEGVGSTFHFDVSCALGDKPCIELESQTQTINPITHSTLTEKKVPHFLLVEDNVIALKIIEIMVNGAGYTFNSAEDGEKALQLAQSIDFDLVITDIGLPGISGYELTQHIRNWENSQNKPSIPIVGLTGHALEAVKQECMDSGMNKVYAKPITQAALQEIASYLHSGASQS
jgi:PAS domain S-box-containing protein